MSKQEKILDDLARLAGGAVGILSDARKQAKATVRAGMDQWAQNMDLVPREDFEKVEAMLAESRLQQAALLKRIEELERKIDKPLNDKKASKKTTATRTKKAKSK